MLIKDQIKSRMTQLGITVPQLAKQLDVSEQSVRFWTAGRNRPGKRHAAKLEAALSCSINWTESSRGSDRPTATNLLDQADVELMLKMSRLPMPIKILIGNLADEIVKDRSVEFAHKVKEAPRRSFSEKSHHKQGVSSDVKKRPGRAASPRKAA